MPATHDQNSRDAFLRDKLARVDRIAVPRRPGFICFTVTAVEAAGLEIAEIADFVKGHDGFVDMPEPSLQGLLPDGREMSGYESADVVTFEVPERVFAPEPG